MIVIHVLLFQRREPGLHRAPCMLFFALSCLHYAVSAYFHQTLRCAFQRKPAPERISFRLWVLPVAMMQSRPSWAVTIWYAIPSSCGSFSNFAAKSSEALTLSPPLKYYDFALLAFDACLRPVSREAPIFARI